MNVGDTRSGSCPSCGKDKFYVTRKPDGFAYICFRASCGYKGYERCGMDTEQTYKPWEREDRGQVYRGHTYNVDWTDMDYFQERFSVILGDSPAHASYWCKVSADNRYVFPIHGPSDEPRGYVLRQPTWAGIPEPVRQSKSTAAKAMSYFEPDVVKMGWYHSTDESTVVIVEDQVSAMRIACSGLTSVAILGTNFYPEFVSDFNRWHRGDFGAILALDPDATHKALGIARKWGPTFKHPLRVACLKRDPKDYETDKELWEDLGL